MAQGDEKQKIGYSLVTAAEVGKAILYDA